MLKGIRADLNLRKGLQVTQEDVIWNDIWNHLMTLPGERPKQPDFGSYFRYYLFEPNTQRLQTLIQNEIERIVDQDPRIEINDITVTPNDNNVTVSLDITLIMTNQRKLLNFDFVRLS